VKRICLISPGQASGRLSIMIEAATSGLPVEALTDTDAIPDLTNKKILFAADLDCTGSSIPLIRLFNTLSERGRDALQGSSAALLVHSESELFTKSAAQNIVFLANRLGCRFPGSPLVEATAGLKNFLTWRKKLGESLEEVCSSLCASLGRRLIEDCPSPVPSPRVLAVHASSHGTSNTLMLWDMIKKHLEDGKITELHVENGTVRDCKGCSYKTCKHFSRQRSCFYGGVMVEEIFPEIERADAIVWICPNYNDSVSANLMAVINRLTALYRRTKFFDKTFFGVIVSGNSGSDSVAKQLIGALNINKSFRLPPYFAVMATANNPGEIETVPGIEERARLFAQNMLAEIKA
jgi:multimeric flavodoxin WrbA